MTSSCCTGMPRPLPSGAAPSSPPWLSTRPRCGSPRPTGSWNTSICGPGCSPRHGGWSRSVRWWCCPGWVSPCVPTAPPSATLVPPPWSTRGYSRWAGETGPSRGGAARWCWAPGAPPAGAGLCRVGIDARHLSRSGPRQAVLDALYLALHHGATRRPTSCPSRRRRRELSIPDPPGVGGAPASDPAAAAGQPSSRTHRTRAWQVGLPDEPDAENQRRGPRHQVDDDRRRRAAQRWC